MKLATPVKYTAVVDITAQAFDDDPVLAWMFRKDSKRSAAVRLFMQTLSRMIYFPRGEAYINDAESGATMWLPPGVSGDIGFFEQLRSVPAMIRISGITGIPNLLRVQTLLEKKHPDKPHYYLFTVAALPKMRGQGIGSGMMEPMTQRFDDQQVPAYLENSREANLPFYMRHGFEVMEQINLPNDGPPMWLMWREPRSTT